MSARKTKLNKMSRSNTLSKLVDKGSDILPFNPDQIVAKLEALNHIDEEEFGLELEELKKKLIEANKSNPSPVRSSTSTPTRGISRNSSRKELPVVLNKTVGLKGILYGLSFRNRSMKKMTELVEETKNVTVVPDTDSIIKQLVNHQGGPVKELKPPELKPRAVCFNYPNTDLTHLEVKRAIDRLLQSFPDIEIETIEFQPRCKLMLPADKKGSICRWVITFDSDWGRKRLTNREFSIRDVSVVLKNYDEIVALEFRQYGRMTQIMKIVKQK